jgi:hypothetical protein
VNNLDALDRDPQLGCDDLRKGRLMALTMAV